MTDRSRRRASMSIYLSHETVFFFMMRRWGCPSGSIEPVAIAGHHLALLKMTP